MRRISVESQLAQVEIRTTQAKLSIRSKRPSFKVVRGDDNGNNVKVQRSQPSRSAPAGVNTQKGYAVPEDEAVHYLTLSKQFDGYREGMSALSRIAAQKTDATAAQESAVRQRAPRMRHHRMDSVMSNQKGAGRLQEEAAEWDPGQMSMNWDSQLAELEWEVHPLEVDYEPYSVEITMKNYPSIRITVEDDLTRVVGSRVDRKI